MISNATMAGLKTAESEFYVQFPNGREYMLICLLRFPNILLGLVVHSAPNHDNLKKRQFVLRRDSGRAEA